MAIRHCALPSMLPSPVENGRLSLTFLWLLPFSSFFFLWPLPFKETRSFVLGPEIQECLHTGPDLAPKAASTRVSSPEHDLAWQLPASAPSCLPFRPSRQTCGHLLLPHRDFVSGGTPLCLMMKGSASRTLSWLHHLFPVRSQSLPSLLFLSPVPRCRDRLGTVSP